MTKERHQTLFLNNNLHVDGNMIYIYDTQRKAFKKIEYKHIKYMNNCYNTKHDTNHDRPITGLLINTHVCFIHTSNVSVIYLQSE